MPTVDLAKQAMFDYVGDPLTLLSDGSDASYMTFGRSAGGGASDNSVSLHPLEVDPAAVTSITLTARLKVTAAHPDPVAVWFDIYRSPTTTESVGSWTVPTDGAFHEVSATVDNSFATLLASSGSAVWVDIGFALDPAHPAPPAGVAYDGVISEFALLVTWGQGVATFRRTFPRDDGLAGGARRTFPPSRALQSGNRTSGGYL